VLAQELHQHRARIDVTGDGLAVHRQSDGGHVYLLGSGQTPCFWRCRPGPAADCVEIRAMLPAFSPETQPRSWTVQATPVRSRHVGHVVAGCSGASAAANFTKNSWAVFLAALWIRRWPRWASLPPICASTSEDRRVPPSLSASDTLALPLAKPATPPSPSPTM